MKTSECIDLISAALAKAHASISHAGKDAKNPHFKNDYASLESVINAGKDALLGAGVIVIQGVSNSTVVTRLQHISGQYFETELALLLGKNDMQGLGSAITYARRYSLAAMLNISQTDDDGEGAKAPAAKPLAKPAAAPAVSKPVIAGIIKSFAGLGITGPEILNYLEIESADALTAKDIEDLKRVGTAIKNGEIAKEDYFPGIGF